jgi:universal stress protein A
MLPFKIILSPTDFSEPSLEALNTAADLAGHFNARLIVVHVVSRVPGYGLGVTDFESFDVAAYQEQLVQVSEQSLKDMTNRPIFNNIDLKTEVRLGDAAMEIILEAEAENVDLIVIATQGRTGISRLVFGSVAEKVVRLAPCPVLTIRAAGGRE